MQDSLRPPQFIERQNVKHELLNLHKESLIRLLVAMEIEMEAKDAVIAELKSKNSKPCSKCDEKANCDPYKALSMDSVDKPNVSLESNADLRRSREILRSRLDDVIKQHRIQISLYQNILTGYQQRHRELITVIEQLRRISDTPNVSMQAIIADRDRLKAQVEKERAQRISLESELNELINSVDSLKAKYNAYIRLCNENSNRLRSCVKQERAKSSLLNRASIADDILRGRNSSDPFSLKDSGTPSSIAFNESVYRRSSMADGSSPAMLRRKMFASRLDSIGTMQSNSTLSSKSISQATVPVQVKSYDVSSRMMLEHENEDLDKILESLHQACRRRNSTSEAKVLHSLFRAVEIGDADFLAQLLKVSSKNLCNAHGFSPLHLAAQLGRLRCIDVLLNSDFDATASDAKGFSAFHYAALNNQLSCLKRLFEKSEIEPDVDLLVHLIFSSRHECFKFLLNQWISSLQNNAQWLTKIIKTSCRISNSAYLCEILKCVPLPDVMNCIEPSMFISSSCLNVLKEFRHSNLRNVVEVAVHIVAVNRSYRIGSIQCGTEITMFSLTTQINDVFDKHIAQLEMGFSDKRIELSITATHTISNFRLDGLEWSISDDFSRFTVNLYDYLVSSNDRNIYIYFKASSASILAYHCIIPMDYAQRYVSMLLKSKRLLLYGPPFSGKHYLAVQLANSVVGHLTECTIVSFSFNARTQMSDFKRYVSKSAIYCSRSENISCALILYDIHLSCGTEAVRSMIQNPSVLLNDTEQLKRPAFTGVYLICTMSKRDTLRSIHDLFSVVFLRSDVEPWKNIPSRALWRVACCPVVNRTHTREEISILKWMSTVTSELLIHTSKLIMQNPTWGHALLLDADGNKTDLLNYLRQQWNNVVSPHIRDQISKKSTRPSESMCQTVLFVLLQRAIIPGCPLSAKEIDFLISGFDGSRCCIRAEESNNVEELTELRIE